MVALREGFHRKENSTAAIVVVINSLTVMYSVDERDKVIEIRTVPQSSVGAPLPIILSDEYRILLAYIIEGSPDSSLDSIVPQREGEDFAVLEFQRYRSFMFGSPNDEAFSGHPLASRGLHPYAFFQIEDSSWIRQLERMNSVHVSHDPTRFALYKHYVFAFHDSTFECVAENFTASKHCGTLESLISVMHSRLAAGGPHF